MAEEQTDVEIEEVAPAPDAIIPSSNQVPTATETAIVPTVVVTCANVSKADAGPPIGTAQPAAVVVEEPDRQDLYKGGVKIGTATEFVIFDAGQKVVKEVAGHLRAMVDAAAVNEVVLWTSSGFRTMKQQEDIVKDKGLASQGGLAAAAGHSNHQNGIAIDFDVRRDSGKPFEWLTMNAWRYGFIRGVTKERWHWEYWGDWGGEENKPEWAKHPKWGAGGHQPKTMFSIVKRVHACGVGNGGRYPMKAGNWWSTYFPSLENHSDYLTGGKTNSWIGYGNAHLPDKFDTLYPGWDSNAGASISPFTNDGTAGVGSNAPTVGVLAMPPQS